MAKSHSLMSVALIASLALVATLEVKRQMTEQQLANLTVRLEQLQLGNQQQNQEAARRIVEEVRAIIDIPEDVEPTVATIVDVETLRQRNPFYEKASNGDHLIVTPERAILYSSAQRKILDVVPVQLQPTEAAAPAEDASEEEPATETVE